MYYREHSVKTAIAVIFSLIIFIPASATIINVPDDYSTIQAGIDASSDGDTVLVQPGMYVENINFNGHNIVLGSLFLTTGDTGYIEQTVIDGDQSGSVVTFENGEDSLAVIDGFTIQYSHIGIQCYLSNPVISNNKIKNSDTGIDIYASHCIIKNNVVTENRDGIVDIGNLPCLVTGNKIYDNSGWGVYCYDLTNPVIMNNAIYANESGGFYGWFSNAAITNNIFWSNFDNEIELLGGSSSISYCDIQGGWPGEGNIDVDPLFRDPDNGDFHLMATYCGDPYDSPCIDAGHPDSIDTYLDCQWGLGTERADMGAYGGNAEPQTDIKEQEFAVPNQFTLSQNYPNPFNATTTISFSLPEPQFVTLKIYDLLGREVQTLVNEQRQSGLHAVDFNASSLSSGIYFYRIQTDDYSESKRMVLLK